MVDDVDIARMFVAEAAIKEAMPPPRERADGASQR